MSGLSEDDIKYDTPSFARLIINTEESRCGFLLASKAGSDVRRTLWVPLLPCWLPTPLPWACCWPPCDDVDTGVCKATLEVRRRRDATTRVESAASLVDGRRLPVLLATGCAGDRLLEEGWTAIISGWTPQRDASTNLAARTPMRPAR